MGGRLSSASNGNGNESTVHSAPTADVAIPGVAQPLAVSQLTSANGTQHSQSRSPEAVDMAARSYVLSMNRRLNAGASVVNGRQLLEVLAASGVNGRAMLSGNEPSSSSNSQATDDSAAMNRTLLTTSLPFLIAFRDVKCPVCHKTIPSDDVECHLVMCLTKPRVIYNEEVLTEDKDQECIICFEELRQDDVIARLPCLCIYHKSCIDQWFEVSRSCPEHPDGSS